MGEGQGSKLKPERDIFTSPWAWTTSPIVDTSSGNLERFVQGRDDSDISRPILLAYPLRRGAPRSLPRRFTNL
jgi:hypothetical protein